MKADEAKVWYWAKEVRDTRYNALPAALLEDILQSWQRPAPGCPPRVENNRHALDTNSRAPGGVPLGTVVRPKKAAALVGSWTSEASTGENSRKFELWSYRRQSCRDCSPCMELTSCQARMCWHEGFPVIPGVTRTRFPGRNLITYLHCPMFEFAPNTGH